MIRYVISGVGRSGTTALYDMISSCVPGAESNWCFCYEPYLWGPQTWDKSPKSFTNEFRFTDSLYPRGIAAHHETNLFTDVLDEGNERFLKGLSTRKPNVLIKFIRASGRLEAILDSDPTMRIVHIVRNPMEVVNSASVLFTFFGDEFHPSDKKRFRTEVEKRWPGRLPGSDMSQVEWNVNWWYFMNLAALETAQRYPDNVLLVSQEALRNEPTESLRRVLSFLDVSINEKVLPEKKGHGYSVGSRVGLSSSEVDAVKPFLAHYEKEFLPFIATADLIDWPSIVEQLEMKFGKDVSGDNQQEYVDYPSNVNGLAARTEIIEQFKKVTQQRERAARWLKKALAQDTTLRQIQRKTGALLQSRIVKGLGPLGGKLRESISNVHQLTLNLTEPAAVTCVVTCYNNAATLDRAVSSLQTQSVPLKAIIIADDCSTDHSRDIAMALTRRFPNVSLVSRDHNVGPGLNRHLAYHEAATPFVTQLDGDDQLAPEKIEAEWKVLKGRLDTVAFSDVLLRNVSGDIKRRETGWFQKLSTTAERVRGMLTRPGFLPHNMLFSKDLYLRSGGYDTSAKMYEDWSLKLRLAKECDRWLHSGTDGLIYNLHGEGLSTAPVAIHNYWQIYCVVKNFRLLTESVGVNAVKLYIGQLMQGATWFQEREDFVKSVKQTPSTFQGRDQLYAALSLVLTSRPPKEIHESQELFSVMNGTLVERKVPND